MNNFRRFPISRIGHCRVSCAKSGSAMSEARTDIYGYNARSELISSRRAAENVEEYAYAYDPIGNRLTSSDLGTTRTYTANNLNQYTEISSLRASAPPRETFMVLPCFCGMYLN